jgi:7-carboxy-7-deazaguanine synthase
VKALLSRLNGRFPVLLETNGIHWREFAGVAGLVDVVSMDVKLPSATGLDPVWDEHAAFIEACRCRELIIKAVVSGLTPREEVARAAGLALEASAGAVFVIQPLTGPDGRPAVDKERLFEFYREARAVRQNVRVIPQVHGVLGVR